ncbi:MAG TPA: hypothetical protein VFD44_04715, partial [Hanamia sp.]|nr:hypothetical protein [Hanamia sp.]
MLKKILLITFGLFAFVFNTYSQKQKGERQFYQGKPIVRCATDQRVKMLFKVFPEKKLEAERLSQLPPSTSLRKAKRLQSVVYLPVVFHIVLQNPYVIS